MWPEGGLWRAAGLRDAAMVALLVLLPMRRRSLASLRLGELILVGEERIVIALSGKLTKTGVPRETDLPPQSARPSSGPTCPTHGRCWPSGDAGRGRTPASGSIGTARG